MKAKVIDTGEIIDCREIDYNVEGRFYCDNDTEKEYHSAELEFISDVDFDKEVDNFYRHESIAQGITDYGDFKAIALYFFNLGKRYAYDMG